jgi:uncharacterized membrane protein YgdD (TMEM256/DUF423 family)
MSDRLDGWRIVAGVFGLCGVILGALAAHGLAEPQATLVERASVYLLIHAAALLAIASRAGRAALLAKTSFTVGVVLFCGSIALKQLAGTAAFGPFAPVGGACLIAGWACVILSALPRLR